MKILNKGIFFKIHIIYLTRQTQNKKRGPKGKGVIIYLIRLTAK
jgi:hypothetical protein